MTNKAIFSALAAACLTGIAVLAPDAVLSQDPGSGKRNKEEYVTSITGTRYKVKRVKDELRKCKNRSINEQKVRKQQETNDKRKAQGQRPVLLNSFSLGNNPREGQYRDEMERLIRIEIDNVTRALGDVEIKHKELIRIYPHLKHYQEIYIEDTPGAFRDGQYVNVKKLIVMHYSTDGKLDCIVLDSFVRNVEYPDQWTRKLIRLYNPNIQMLELETHRHNFVMHGSLELTSPEIQLRGLRLVYKNLRTALYSMDMVIASYYDLKEKQNSWQLSF